MIKKLLLSLVAIAFTGAVSAQVLPIKPSHKFANNSSKVEKVKLPKGANKAANGKMWISPKGQDITPMNTVVPMLAKAPKAADDATKIWWSYPAADSLGIRGWRMADYDLAIVVPEALAGAKVDSVSILFFDASKLSNVRVWFFGTQYDEQGYIQVPSSPETADYYFDVNTSDINSFQETADGMTLSSTDLKLPQTYTIPENGCLVGYAFTTAYNPNNQDDNGNYPVVTYSSTDVEGGFLMKFPTEDGFTWESASGYNYGNLTTSIHADVTGLASSEVSAGNMGESTAMLNEKTSLSVPVMNNGYSAIKSVSYVVAANGGAPSTEQTYTFRTPLAANASYYIDVPVTPTQEGLNSFSVTITKVDGSANTSTTNVSTCDLVAIEKAAERTSVVEQFTGTWCGWCPRGHVGMEKMKKTFSDKVITLAGHSDDVMACANYTNVMNTFASGLPAAAFDRVVVGDPYLGLTDTLDARGHVVYGGDDAIKLVKEVIPSEGTIALDAKWSDDTRTKIDATTTTTLNYDRFDAPYAIAYILSEDGMTGTGNDWLQSNYYSPAYASQISYREEFNVADLQYWYTGAANVATDYDNVVVAAWGALEGVEGSVDANIYKNDPMTYNTTLDISSNTLVQDKDKLSLTALLINKNNYAIVNAAQVPFGYIAGIDGVTTDTQNSEVARYNVNGMRLSAPQKGLNIVKMANGKSVKVMVK